MRSKIIWAAGMLIVVFFILILLISGNFSCSSRVWLKENPYKYMEAISEFVDIPNNTEYNVIKRGPNDGKPYTDFSFMFWWNKGEWYYKVVGHTAPSQINSINNS